MKAELLSLSQVIDEFKEWRASRVKQSRIPDHLWKHVIPLLSDHPRSTVLGRLGISHGQLKKHMNIQSSMPQSKAEIQAHKSGGHGFIECKLPLDKITPTDSLPCCDIELKKPNGATLLIKMANQTLLSSLIRSFIE
jgi:hypothetical protein